MIAFCLFENIKHIYPAVPLNLDDLKCAAAELAGGNKQSNNGVYISTKYDTITEAFINT